MKNSSKKPSAAAPESMFRLSPVAAGAAMMLVAMGAAQAQTGPSTQPAAADASQTVTVTGIRRGIENAINIKKNADSIVEAISAEDIGKLPDVSVAEAISRLPGLSTQRDKQTGRAASVSVRGLAPDFTTGTLNGREQASTSDSRGVNFDQFPAELLGGVLVYKSPVADQLNQGLGATIDLRTVRPLDFAKRTAAVNYRKQTSGVGLPTEEGTGSRTSLSYVDQFADRTIGIALGFTKFKDDGAGQLKFDSWGGWTPDVPFGTGTVKVPGGFTADTEQTTTKRDGAMAVLQFKPNKNFESTLDYFYTKGNFKTSKKGLEGAIGGQSAGPYDPAGVLSNATVVNGVAESGTLSNYKGVVRNHDEAFDDDLKSIGWNNRLNLGEWTGIVDLSQSKVTKHNTRYETTAGQVGNHSTGAGTTAPLGTISWTGFNGSNFEQVKYSTSLDYSNPVIAKLTDVNGWGGGGATIQEIQAGFLAQPVTTDDLSSLRLSGKRNLSLGPLTEIELGFNATKREKGHQTNSGRLVIKGSVNQTTGQVLDPYAFKEVPGAGVATAGTTGLKVISWNPLGSLGTIYELPPLVDRFILNGNWDVAEKVNTFYVKNGVELADGKVRGNIGVQVVHTDQIGAGFFVNPTTCTGNTVALCPSTRVQRGTDFYDVLPSVNLAMDLGDDTVLRVGFGKSMSRPTMNDMRGSAEFDVNVAAPGGPRIEGKGGNPLLKPFRANVADVSYEKYFGTKAYFAVAGFYKDLRSYIYNQQQGIDFRNFGVALPPGFNPIGVFTQPANGTGGTIVGMELTASVPFGMYVKALDGFGVQVNYSHTDSSVSLPAAGLTTKEVNVDNLPMPGLSRNVTNFRFYYEKYGFQVAIAKRTRSDFLGEVSDFADTRTLTFVKGESTVDLQLSYELQSGPLRGLSVMFQGQNLTKTAFQRYRADTGAVVENVPTGKTYLFGLNYKL